MSEVKNSKSEENGNENEEDDRYNDDVDNQEKSKEDKDMNQEKDKEDKDINQEESREGKGENDDETKEDRDINLEGINEGKGESDDESKEDNSIGDTTSYVSATADLQQSNSPTKYDATSDSKTIPHKRKGFHKQDGVKTKSLLNDDVSDDDQLYHQKNPEDVENAVKDDIDGDDRDKEEVEVRSLLPKRHVLLLMIFLGFAVVYSLRVNINVAIVAMVNNRTSMTRSGRINIHVST